MILVWDMVSLGAVGLSRIEMLWVAGSVVERKLGLRIVGM